MAIEQLICGSDHEEFGLQRLETDSCMEELSAANSAVSTVLPELQCLKKHDLTVAKLVSPEHLQAKVIEPSLTACPEKAPLIPIQAESAPVTVSRTPPAEEQPSAVQYQQVQSGNELPEELLGIQGRWDTDRVGSLEVIGDLVRYDRLPSVSYRVGIEGDNLVLDGWRAEARCPFGLVPRYLLWEFEGAGGGSGHIKWSRKGSPVGGHESIPVAKPVQFPIPSPISPRHASVAQPQLTAQAFPWPFARIQGQWETTSFGSVIVDGEYAKFSSTPVPGIKLRFDHTSNKLILQEWSAEVSQIGHPDFRLLRWTTRCGSEVERVTWHRLPETSTSLATANGTRLRKPPPKREVLLPPSTPRPQRTAAKTKERENTEILTPKSARAKLASKIGTRQGNTKKRPRTQTNKESENEGHRSASLRKERHCTQAANEERVEHAPTQSTRQGGVKRRQSAKLNEKLEKEERNTASSEENDIISALRRELEAKSAELQNLQKKQKPCDPIQTVPPVQLPRKPAQVSKARGNNSKEIRRKPAAFDSDTKVGAQKKRGGRLGGAALENDKGSKRPTAEDRKRLQPASKFEPLSKQTKIELQRKLDALDDDQLDKVLEFLKPELGGADGEEVNLNLNALTPERQHALQAMVDGLLSNAIAARPETVASAIPTVAAIVSEPPRGCASHVTMASIAASLPPLESAKGLDTDSLMTESMLHCSDEVLSMMEGS